MAQLRIFGIAQSRAFRTLWMAEELGLSYEHVRLSFDEASVKSAAYLAINPNGKVPAIDDGGFVMWESLAINLYLAKKHADRRLYPTAIEDEARVWQWSFWAVNELEPPIVAWMLHTIIFPPERRSSQAVADAMAQLTRPLAILDDALGDRAYLLGSDFSVADLNLAAILYRLVVTRHATGPHVAAWLEHCYDRPAAQRARRLREAA